MNKFQMLKQIVECCPYENHKDVIINEMLKFDTTIIKNLYVSGSRCFSFRNNLSRAFEGDLKNKKPPGYPERNDLERSWWNGARKRFYYSNI